MIWDSLPVVLYMAALLALGFAGMSKIRTASDFSSSEEGCGTAVLFASLSASFIGGGYSAGNASAAFEEGLRTTAALCGFGISMILIGRFLAPGAVRFRGEHTVGGVIGRSFGKRARVVTGVFSFLCCACVVGAQVQGMGTVLHVLFGVPETAGILIGSGVVIIYSTCGGLQSVIAADVVQFALLALGMPLLLWRGLTLTGGFEGLLAAVPPERLDPLAGEGILPFLSLFLMMGMGEALAPPYTQRLLIAKTPKNAARAGIWSGLFSLPFFVLTGLIGLTALALQVTDEPSLAMPALVSAVLPVGLRGLVMAAMVSMMLSAADSFLNSAAISLIEDTVVPLYPAMKDARRLLWMRVVNAGTGAAAVAVALCMPNIFDILMLSYSFWCPVILVPLAAALRGRTASGRAFAVSAVSACAVTCIWNVLLQKPFGVDGAILGTLLSTVLFLPACRPAFRLAVKKDAASAKDKAPKIGRSVKNAVKNRF